MESSDSRFDDQQMSVELRRIELDAELRRAELQEKRASREAEEKKQDEANVLKQKELDISAGRGVRFTAAQATVVAAALALVSGAIGGGIQAIASRDAQIAIERLKADASIELQRQQFESTLILDVTKNVNLAPLCAKISETPSLPGFSVEGGEGNAHEEDVNGAWRCTDSPGYSAWWRHKA